MSDKVTDNDYFTPLHVSVGCDNPEATNIFFSERPAVLKNSKKYIINPLIVAAQCGKL